eukprot:549164_1
MGVEKRAKWRKKSSSENGAFDLYTSSPNIQTEAAIVNSSDGTCGGDSSADPSFKIWKLQLILMVDTLGAALVVPLMQSYFQEISPSPEKFGYMRSIYSIAQIVGGLLIGIGSDTIISKKTAIIVSSVGSVISYAIVASLHFLPHPLFYLVLSRFIVGLAKHSTAAGVGLIAQHITNPLDHPTSLGRIGAASTFSLIIGPSMGSTLYGIDKSLPPMVSCGLSALNVLLTLWLLPGDKIKITKEFSSTIANDKSKQRGFVQNVRLLQEEVPSGVFCAWVCTVIQGIGISYYEGFHCGYFCTLHRPLTSCGIRWHVLAINIVYH